MSWIPCCFASCIDVVVPLMSLTRFHDIAVKHVVVFGRKARGWGPILKGTLVKDGNGVVEAA